MVIGLAIIVTVLQPWLERFVLFLLLWGKERKLGTIVRKCLNSHRRRNQKT